MSIKDEVRELAVGYFKAILPISASDNGLFKGVITGKFDGTAKPVLLLGNAHSRMEDGHCIAIVNPDKELVDELTPGCGYSASILREIVAKRCDLAMDVWVDAYKKNGIYASQVYKTRTPQPAKFAVD